ncbi:hypothetical protein OXPF_06950 [Oxobacter pfennigii]|uniref:Uncharacterized protein n=1 Tax=Oxobacter pfennigii TaxID=36849 RepID=A0A0P8X3T6_9CLOT|nr:winged helix-turn-helix transcriptional regulator [Oxobacter pfennigii]KPU45462.1 hypothetical protein OXPF_06950 [Oxobacter pfennigii]
MRCSKCNTTIPEDEVCNYLGQSLCEDCYIAKIAPPKPCDVSAVHSAKTHRAAAGHTGSDGLTELQKKMYNYIKENGKATKQELCEKLNLSSLELDRQISVLRHCEVLKAQKTDNSVYIVLW